MKVHFDFTQEAQPTDDGKNWKTILHSSDAPPNWSIEILIPKAHGTEIFEFRNGDLIQFDSSHRIRINGKWLSLNGINYGATDTDITNAIAHGNAVLLSRGPN